MSISTSRHDGRLNESRNANESNRAMANIHRNDNRNQLKNRATSNNILCYNCFEMGHISVKCPKPQRRNRCTICQRTSHTAEQCPEKKSSTDASGNCRKITDDVSETKVVFKEILVNNVRIQSFIDPGSDRSLIKESAAAELSSIVSCEPHILKGFAGGEVICNSKVEVNLQVDDKHFNVELLVVHDAVLNEVILLGSDILCRKGYRFVIENGECRLESLQFENMEMGTDLNSYEKQEVINVISEYADCFAEKSSELGKCSLEKMKIELTTDEPIAIKPYRIPFTKRSIVEDILSDLLNNGIIRHSESPYAFPIVLVQKSNNEHRM